MELNLLQTPLPYISGDFAELNETANIIFPQVLNSMTAVYSLNGVSFHDGYEINNGYRARIRNHGHSCFLCEIVIRSQFHTTYEPEA